MMTNTKIVLAKRPEGFIDDDNFELQTELLPELNEGSLLIKIEAISLDPAIRGWMNERTTYIKGIEIGAVIRAFSVGQVIASKHPEFKEGDKVSGMLGAQTYCISDGAQLHLINKPQETLSYHLGVLGMPGMTAYFGLLEKGKPTAGDVIFISGAAGVVGATVGQIAKIKGCTVIGSAGSSAKCKYLKEECHFDHVINYKKEDIDHQLKTYAPEGIHIYYDNVGGPTLDIALKNLAHGARVVICGAISQYNAPEMYGPKNYMKIVTARATLTGVIVFDYVVSFPKAVEEISAWIAAGKIKVKEHKVHGLPQFPSALKMLYTGENFGKLILTL